VCGGEGEKKAGCRDTGEFKREGEEEREVVWVRARGREMEDEEKNVGERKVQ
jgi:hypothetical protein